MTETDKQIIQEFEKEFCYTNKKGLKMNANFHIAIELRAFILAATAKTRAAVKKKDIEAIEEFIAWVSEEGYPHLEQIPKDALITNLYWLLAKLKTEQGEEK